MPTILQSLQKHDLGHLQIIAEGWDLPFQAPDVREGRKVLAAAMRKAGATLTELVEDLDPQAQSALSDLIGAGGQIPWHKFIEQYGEVREIGPGRRDREKPWLSPISTTERLWYLGLISRDFFDSAAGPQEFAYIPDDLLSRMPDFLRIQPAAAYHLSHASDHALFRRAAHCLRPRRRQGARMAQRTVPLRCRRQG
ncbi:MAG: hypothetical protein ACK2T7_01760, partial [Anaerolineales bacterium]